jgi:hypothetical protein
MLLSWHLGYQQRVIELVIVPMIVMMMGVRTVMLGRAKREWQVCVSIVRVSDVGVSAMRNPRGCHEVVRLTQTRSALLISTRLFVRIITKFIKYTTT